MLPGRKYTPDDVLQILRRRIWWVLVPFAVVSAATVLVASRLPDYYSSETILQIVPQQVPSNYVQAIPARGIEDRLPAIKEQILSRTRLESTIQEFNLYPEDRSRLLMEDIVEKMRHDISVDIINGSDTFRVAYVGRDPQTVKKVTERLASLAVDETLRDRSAETDRTSEFLDQELSDVRAQLQDQETKLAEYRRLHAGELPTQVESNLQQVQSAQMQIQQLTEANSHDEDQRLFDARQLSDLNNQMDAPPPVSASTATAAADSSAPPAGGTTEQQLQSARARLAALQMRFTDDHPDVQAAKRLVRDLEDKANAEALEAPVSAVSPGDAARQKQRADLAAQIAMLDRQIADRNKEIEQFRQQADVYQQRANAAPTRETEMTELMRNYSTLETRYNSLLAKKEDSRMAADLEREQIGEQFRVVDPARVPQRPDGPNRRQIGLLGMVGGLGVGLAFVALFEYRDSTFRTDEDATRLLALPVLAVVPLMRSTDDWRRARRRRWAVGFGLGSAVMACLAVVAYSFLRVF